MAVRQAVSASACGACEVPFEVAFADLVAYQENEALGHAGLAASRVAYIAGIPLVGSISASGGWWCWEGSRFRSW